MPLGGAAAQYVGAGAREQQHADGRADEGRRFGVRGRGLARGDATLRSLLGGRRLLRGLRLLVNALLLGFGPLVVDAFFAASAFSSAAALSLGDSSATDAGCVRVSSDATAAETGSNIAPAATADRTTRRER